MSRDLNLFHAVEAESIFECMAEFYATAGHPLVDEGDAEWRSTIHVRHNDWVVVDLGHGVEWRLRRGALAAITKRLARPALLTWVDEAGSWGYELFVQGHVLDRFCLDPWTTQVQDPAEWKGRADLLANQLAWLQPESIEPYLVRKPNAEHFPPSPPPSTLESAFSQELRRLDVPPRPGDSHARFDKLAFINVLRLLQIDSVIRDESIVIAAPVAQRFWIEGQRQFWKEPGTIDGRALGPV